MADYYFHCHPYYWRLHNNWSRCDPLETLLESLMKNPLVQSFVLGTCQKSETILEIWTKTKYWIGGFEVPMSVLMDSYVEWIDLKYWNYCSWSIQHRFRMSWPNFGHFPRQNLVNFWRIPCWTWLTNMIRSLHLNSGKICSEVSFFDSRWEPEVWRWSLFGCPWDGDDDDYYDVL